MTETQTYNALKHQSKSKLQQYFLHRFNTQLVHILGKIHPVTILDAGCGEGFTLQKLKHEKIGKKHVGIDFSEDALQIGHHVHPRLDLRHESIYQLPFRDTSFDVVICTEVLEHLEYPIQAMREIIRVTRAHLVLSVPNEPLFQMANFLRGKYSSTWGNHPEHRSHWSAHSFRTLLEKQKLTIQKVYTPFPWILIHATV